MGRGGRRHPWRYARGRPRARHAALDPGTKAAWTQSMMTGHTSTWASNVLRFGRAGRDFSGRVMHGLVWPKVDFLIRIALAEIFFVSGVLKLTHWDTALYLAANE